MRRKRPQYTQMVGQAGCEGIRLVRVGGVGLWLSHRYQDDRLVPHVGREVYIADRDGEIYINEGGFDAKNRALCGKWIVTIWNY